LWRIPAESARRVGHPAPFPVELPLRLIELYTYAGDLVLDPFLGSGSAAVAAVRAGRRYAGYDIDPGYIATARARVEEEQARLRALAVAGGDGPASEAWGRAEGEGRGAAAVAELLVEAAGFVVTQRNRPLPGTGLAVDLVATAADGREWCFDVTGGFTTLRGGLSRADVLWRALGRAHVLRAAGGAPPVFLTSHLPGPGTPGDAALRAVGPAGVFDVVAMGSPGGRDRLAAYAAGGRHRHRPPVPAFVFRCIPVTERRLRGRGRGSAAGAVRARSRRTARRGSHRRPDAARSRRPRDRGRPGADGPAAPLGRRRLGRPNRHRPVRRPRRSAAPARVGLSQCRRAGLAVGRRPREVRRPRNRLPVGRPPRHQRP